MEELEKRILELEYKQRMLEKELHLYQSDALDKIVDMRASCFLGYPNNYEWSRKAAIRTLKPEYRKLVI